MNIKASYEIFISALCNLCNYRYIELLPSVFKHKHRNALYLYWTTLKQSLLVESWTRNLMFDKFSQSVWLRFLLSCHCSWCRIVMPQTHYTVPIILGLMKRPYNVNPQQWYVRQQCHLMNPEMLSVHAFMNPYPYHIWNFLFASQKSWHST